MSAHQTTEPNILLFICDDLRWDALACAGDPVVKTPNIDRLAARGVRFSRCYMPGGTHGAVCMPSRAMVHTGRSLFRIENEGQEIPDTHLSLGEHLQSLGYDACHIGKWHNGKRCFNRLFNQGDEIFFGGMDDQWNMPLYRYDPSGEYASRLPWVRDPKLEKEMRYREADHTSDGRHATEVFCQAASHYLQDRSDNAKPFFLSVALTAPHDPRTAPPRFHDLYPPTEMELPANFLSQHPHDTGQLRQRDENLAALPRRPAEIKEHLSDYYAMITHLDEEFGKLLDDLDKQGLAENTIVAFTADHGIAIGQHGLMGKQCLYDHSLRVPLILAGPGLPQGEVCPQLVLHYDLFATFCELLGQDTPQGLDSRSLLPTVSGAPGRDELYLAFGTSMRGLLKGNFKLIEYAAQDYRATQLFDLEADPLERCDRAHDPEYHQQLNTLRQRLLELSEPTGDRSHPSGQSYWPHFKS